MKKLFYLVLVTICLTGFYLPATSSGVNSTLVRDCAQEAADFLEMMLNDGYYTPTQAAAMAVLEYNNCIEETRPPEIPD